jgi:hypothetical protein
MRKLFKISILRGLSLIAAFLLLSGPPTKAQTYCTSDGQMILSRQVWIERFDAGSISNLSGNNNGYGNFTSQTASCVAR